MSGPEADGLASVTIVPGVGVRSLVGLCDADAAARHRSVQLLRRTVRVTSLNLWALEDTTWSPTAVGEWGEPQPEVEGSDPEPDVEVHP